MFSVKYTFSDAFFFSFSFRIYVCFQTVFITWKHSNLGPLYLKKNLALLSKSLLHIRFSSDMFTSQRNLSTFDSNIYTYFFEFAVNFLWERTVVRHTGCPTALYLCRTVGTSDCGEIVCLAVQISDIAIVRWSTFPITSRTNGRSR